MLTEEEIKNLKIGDRIQHSIIGEGKVVEDYDPLSQMIWFKWVNGRAGISCVDGYQLGAPGWEHITVVEEDETLDLNLDMQEINDHSKKTEIPVDNQGRKYCYWCSQKTRKIEGLFETYDFCDDCEK